MRIRSANRAWAEQRHRNGRIRDRRIRDRRIDERRKRGFEWRQRRIARQRELGWIRERRRCWRDQRWWWNRRDGAGYRLSRLRRARGQCSVADGGWLQLAART